MKAILISGVLGFLVSWTAAAPVYYLRPLPANQYQLARINPDGTGDQVVNLALPVPTFPEWSRDGSVLALTSVDPQRPSKISQDVFAYFPATGAAQLVVEFNDLVTQEPVVIGGVQGQQSKFSYVVPLYKAFSPDRGRIAVATMVTSGFFQGQETPAIDLLTGTSQIPILQIYNTANGLLEDTVIAGRVRTFYTLGGFGVDWHPTQNLLVAPIDVDAPTTGSLSPSESSALFLIEAVPNAVALGKGRQLTHPQGFLQSTLLSTTTSVESDYAPAFSPDGQTIAYLRAENTIDSSGFVTQHRPISVSIRAVNFDGTGDRQVLGLAAGLFVSQLSWSPDGQQLVFDTGSQPTPQANQLARLEAIPSTLQLNVVNVDGSNPHLLRAAPAGIPAWQPGNVAVPGQLTIQRVPGTPPSIVLSWPAALGASIESSAALGPAADWKAVQLPIQSTAGQNALTIPLTDKTTYFRLR